MLGLKADSETRYKLFIKKITETGKVFTISNGETAAMYPSNEYVLMDGEYTRVDIVDDDEEPASLVPFWSNRAYPTAWLKDSSEEGLSIVELDLQEFFNILCHYEELDAPVGIEWNQGVGIEIQASIVLDEIEPLLVS